MSVRIYIYDRSDNLITDPEQATEYATGLRYSRRVPKGYHTCTFEVRRDIAMTWVIKSAYKIILRDGLKIVWQGIVENINLGTDSSGDRVRVDCVGAISILARRLVRKRWTDNAALSRFFWPSDQESDSVQNTWNCTIVEDLLRVKLPGEAVTSANGDDFHYQYDNVTGRKIYRVTFDYHLQAGASDTFRIVVWNEDQEAQETYREESDSSSSNGSVDQTIAQGDTESFQIRFVLQGTDSDADGVALIGNLIVYSEYDYTSGIGSSYADEIIKDILYIVDNSEGDLSTDYDQIASPGLAIIPFTTKSDTYETADSVIQRLAAFGDSSNDTWEFNVWDQEYNGAASDSQPKVELRERPATTDWEYEVWLAGEYTEDFTYEESLQELYNWVAVEYTDANNRTSFVSPDTDSTLKDSTSITDYGRRDKLLRIGKSDSATATNAGKRYLAHHKDPLIKGQLTVRGQIKKKNGPFVPAAWVRAGQRVKIMYFKGGKVIYLQEIDYNTDTFVLRMMPDLPPDNLAVIQAQEALHQKNPVL